MSSRKSKRSATSNQLDLPMHSWGGRRDGAGRKPTREAGVHHVRRSPLGHTQPVHVSTRMLDIRSLRRGLCYRAVRMALSEGCLRPDFRVVEFSIMSNHIHLICEADDRRALARGLQGLFIRIAKRLNHTLNRRGKVFQDRYHDHVLRTPSEARWALAYVLKNARHHAAPGRYSPHWLDPCSSARDFHGWTGRFEVERRLEYEAPMPRARSWLLVSGWRRAGPIRVGLKPGSLRKSSKRHPSEQARLNPDPTGWAIPT